MESEFLNCLRTAKKSLVARCAIAAIAAPLSLGPAQAAGVPAAVWAGREQQNVQNSIVRANSHDAIPHPGTEDSLRRYIQSLETDQPNYDEMTPGLADAVRRQLPNVLDTIKPWGALHSIAFEGRDARGMDVYRVHFAHGIAQWMIGPLTVDGKVALQGFRPLSRS